MFRLSNGICDCSSILLSDTVLEITRSSGHGAVTRISESSTIGSAIASSETFVDTIAIDGNSRDKITLAVVGTEDIVLCTSGICNGRTVHQETCGRGSAVGRAGRHVPDTGDVIRSGRHECEPIRISHFEVAVCSPNPTTTASSIIAYGHTAIEVWR